MLVHIAATLTQQHSDDIKVVTHEVKDCKAKLDSFRAYDSCCCLFAFALWRRLRA